MKLLKYVSGNYKAVRVMAGQLSDAPRREINAPISEGLSRDVTAGGPPRGQATTPTQRFNKTTRCKGQSQACSPLAFPL